MTPLITLRRRHYCRTTSYPATICSQDTDQGASRTHRWLFLWAFGPNLKYFKGGLVGKYSHDQTSDTVLCSGVQRKIEFYSAVELFWYKLNAAYIYTYIYTPIHLVILHFYFRTNTIKIYGYNIMWLYQHTLVLWLKWSTNTRTNQLNTPWFHFPGDHFTWFVNIPRSWKPTVSSTWNRPREVLVSHVSPWNVMFNGNGFVAVGQLPRSQWINLLMFRGYTWISHQMLIDDLNKFIGSIP